MKYASITGRLSGLGSAKWAVHLEGRRRHHEGEPLTFLSIGEPDLPPPASVIERAVQSLYAGRVRYADGQGEPVARHAIANHLSRRSGTAIDADQVVAFAGTQNALFTSIMTLAEHGDDVLVPDPCYATYEGIIAASGASMVRVPTLPEDGFHLTAEQLRAAITPRSKVLLLNTPANPTGAVLSAAELDAIGEVCIEHDVWIVCDEVYADLPFDVPFVSPFDRLHLRERTIAVASISKSHALPGFRTGWAVGSPETAGRLRALGEAILFGSQPFLADAVAEALNSEHPEVAELRTTFQTRARALVAAFEGCTAATARMPEGGMFVMVDIRPTGLSGEEFAWRLMDEEHVVAMPGESFGPGGAGHLRVALTVPVDEMTEACRRIRALAERAVAERHGD